MSKRPESHRRPVTLDELRQITGATIGAANIEALPPQLVTRCGPDRWHLTDRGWRWLLGDHFAAILNAGSVTSYRDRTRHRKPATLESVASRYGEEVDAA